LRSLRLVSQNCSVSRVSEDMGGAAWIFLPSWPVRAAFGEEPCLSGVLGSGPFFSPAADWAAYSVRTGRSAHGVRGSSKRSQTAEIFVSLRDSGSQILTSSHPHILRRPSRRLLRAWNLVTVSGTAQGMKIEHCEEWRDWYNSYAGHEYGLAGPAAAIQALRIIRSVQQSVRRCTGRSTITLVKTGCCAPVF
jgi:hypothetical protein